MVQKKVGKANNFKTEKQQAIIKPNPHNHDGKSKGADLKAIKMKKSRSIKRSNLDISLQSSQQPRKPLPCVTPANTPSPKTPLPCKSPYTFPNYMRSTSSSEARKEKTSKVSNNLSTSKLHRVAKTLTKTSTLEKMRTLTKAPSFKHTRSLGACKKVVLCQSNLDVQKATCSSTLKDSNFPTYLKLKPGATEAEGNSVFKVCPYNYCSLNGHHHIPAPPLKRFLSSRRKLLKSLKFRPEVLSSPWKVTPSEESDQNNDLFIEVYVPDREVVTQLFESLSDGPCSEIEFQDNLDQVKVTYLSSTKNTSLADEGYLQTPIEKQTSFDSVSVSLDDSFGENSDMEWEEGQGTVTYDKCEIFVQRDYSEDQDKPEFELNNSDCGYLEFLAEEYPPCSHDEIVECLYFSDTESLTDSESTHTGDKHVDDMNSEPSKKIIEDFKLPDKATVSAAKHEDESIGKRGGIFSDTFEGITELQNEKLVSNQDLDERNNGHESNEENYTVEEKKAAEVVIEERKPSEETSKHVPTMTDDLKASNAKEEIFLANSDDQTETNHNVSGNEADNFIHRRSTNSDNNNEKDPNRVSFIENNDAKVKTSRMKDHHKTEEADDVPPTIGNNKQEAIKNVSSKIRRLGCRKLDEETEEEREFNPREPNFLAEEPEPEAEKVDLRHQEMDERRNAEEWMLDYALQKTVNQLAPARKRKVALLVEAFESVLPTPKCELIRRTRPPGCAHGRTLQACS